MILRRERVQGDPRGPGGPPTIYAERSLTRKVSGIGRECVRYAAAYRRVDLAITPRGISAPAPVAIAPSGVVTGGSIICIMA